MDSIVAQQALGADFFNRIGQGRPNIKGERELASWVPSVRFYPLVVEVQVEVQVEAEGASTKK